MMMLILGIILVITSVIGFIIHIQNIKERWELESKLNLN